MKRYEITITIESNQSAHNLENDLEAVVELLETREIDVTSSYLDELDD